VLCLDEFGPLEVKPLLGANWRLMGRPDRIPATYHRTQGVQHLFAVYDLKEDRLYAHMKQRKRGREFLGFLRYVRRRYGREKLYIVLDNYSTHKMGKVLEYARENDIELVYTPTNASWLNRIECEFTAVKKFALENSCYTTKKEQASAIRRYILWRNKHPRNKKLLQIKKRNQVG
jgi:transposase